MLKNFPNTNFFTKHNSAINLNNYLPLSKNNNTIRKNYKFNELNPTHSESYFIAQKTRNYKTPNRQQKSKIANSYINLNPERIPNSLKNPKKTESFFSGQNNPRTTSNSLLNSVRYISSPILNQNNSYKYSFSSNIENPHPKKTLILDLDETLVHSGFYPFERKSDIVLKINIDGKNHIIHVLKRPNLDYFLKKVSEFFNIIIFTASISQYAEPLIDILDPEKKFKRMFRQHCVRKNGFYIKDLEQIGIDFKNIIIIDNNPRSFIMNQENGLPIITWYENLSDNELIKLIPLLEYLSNVSDVRPIIEQIVNKEKNEIDFNLVKNLYLNNNNKNGNEINNNAMNNGSYNDNLIIRENEIKLNNKYINNLKTRKDLYNNNYFYNGNDKIYNFLYSNSKIYNSLSNMSYDEIQNEGYAENDKINNEDELTNNNYIFNNYRKNIIKNKNKINLFLKTKEIFNISNNKENKNKYIQNENNKQIDNVNCFYDNMANNNININRFPEENENIIIKNEINTNNNYNFIYGERKNIYHINNVNDINNLKLKNFNGNEEENNNHKIYKENISTNYKEHKKGKDNSFDGIKNINSEKNSENEINIINNYRSNSVVNKKKPKNINSVNNKEKRNSNNFNQQNLYKKPINIKEKEKNNNQIIYEPKKITKNETNNENQEDNIYNSKIQLRRERLKEMKKKIDEINKDIKRAEKYYYEANKMANLKNRDDIYNTNFKTSRHMYNRINIDYQEENNIDNDINIKSYKVQIMDTDINRNDNKENIDMNKQENLFNKKNNNSNVNIYRNRKIKYLFEHKSDTASVNNKYLKKKEKDLYFQVPNLKKGKNKDNIYKNYTNNVINKSNGKTNKSSNQSKSEIS